MTIREMRDELRGSLSPAVGEAEAKAMANIIIEDIKGYTPTQMVMYGDRQLLDETVDRIRHVAARIADGEPMQYVIGTARFRGRDFSVSPAVLIPRPETGQLVDMIVDDYRNHPDSRVLDLGCGSGCIAISLALDLPFAKVDAIDISAAAVATTSDNAKRLKARVNAYQADIFRLSDSPIAGNAYDIIVSNPPYILQSEARDMDTRVKDHEPHQALFVDDSKPISIYEAIADYASSHLSDHGCLYLEINPLCAAQLSSMLRAKGLGEVNIVSDYRSNKRFAIARP